MDERPKRRNKVSLSNCSGVVWKSKRDEKSKGFTHGGSRGYGNSARGFKTPKHVNLEDLSSMKTSTDLFSRWAGRSRRSL